MASSENKNLIFDYDQKRDVLYAFIDHPQAAVCEETDVGVLIRRDPHTKAVIGFTIYNYSRKKKRGLLTEIPYFPNIQIPF